MTAIRRYGALAAALVLLGGMLPADASDSNWAIRYRVVGLTRVSQDYEVLIYRDGRVWYMGGHAVKVQGEASKQISSDSVRKLLRYIKTSGLFEMRDTYVRQTTTPEPERKRMDAETSNDPTRYRAPRSYTIGESDLIWLFEIDSGSGYKRVVHDRLSGDGTANGARSRLRCIAAHIENAVDIVSWTGRYSIANGVPESCGSK